jgi:hypothetical protein
MRMPEGGHTDLGWAGWVVGYPSRNPVLLVHSEIDRRGFSAPVPPRGLLVTLRTVARPAAALAPRPRGAGNGRG